ncbi:diacylglycerol/polyprenol kinase family protein [Lyngbya confervoides]|uniref:Phosphatidate cytidylyltransferase n=1 Tax=Lyngbya confervoides BDU141951 TaxID=1574623 RepID=A0ABD4SYP9_9CYAN|nr:phosphatidate cytidylyltransferase [Lyngbya confervoides]MCM1981534.1 hypothetical protein [Lyngbya confervoides BDU141951]
MIDFLVTWRNPLAMGVTLMGATLWLRLWDSLAAQGRIESKLSRKIIHITTGPLFVLCWPLFDASFSARGWAALVPGVLTAQFLAVGMGWIDDPAAVQAMTRQGQRGELLKGPLQYGLVFVGCTLVFWRSSPLSLTALMTICGGDGLADIVGRRYGRHKLPWNGQKSWAGSLAMFLGALGLTVLMLSLFDALQLVRAPLGTGQEWGKVVLILSGATLVESLPLRDVDNLTITLATLGLGIWLWGSDLF